MCLEQAHIYFRVLFFLRLECQKTYQTRGNSTLVFQTAGQIETRFPAGSRDVNRKCRDQNMSTRFSRHFTACSCPDEGPCFGQCEVTVGQRAGRAVPPMASPKVRETRLQAGTARHSRAPGGCAKAIHDMNGLPCP